MRHLVYCQLLIFHVKLNSSYKQMESFDGGFEESWEDSWEDRCKT
jgi:hypothetical protein